MASERQFISPWSRHEFPHRFLRRNPLVKNRCNLLSNGHFDAQPTGETERRVGGANTFGHLAAHVRKNVRKTTTATQFQSDMAVTGQRASAGEDQVAKP